MIRHRGTRICSQMRVRCIHQHAIGGRSRAKHNHRYQASSLQITKQTNVLRYQQLRYSYHNACAAFSSTSTSTSTSTSSNINSTRTEINPSFSEKPLENSNSFLHDKEHARAPTDPFINRKNDLMQYLQNELWHEVDRIMDRIDAVVETNLESKHAHASSLQDRVEKGYQQRKKWSRRKDFILEKNRERLEKRREKDRLCGLQQSVVEEGRGGGGVPNGALDEGVRAASTINTIDNLDNDQNDAIANENGDKDDHVSANYMNDVEEETISDDLLLEGDDFQTDLESPKTSFTLMSLLDDAESSFTHLDQGDGGTGQENAAAGEKNRLLALLENQDSKEAPEGFGTQPKVNLMDLLDDNDYGIDSVVTEAKPAGDKNSLVSEKKSLLDLLDEDFFHTDDDIVTHGATHETTVDVSMVSDDSGANKDNSSLLSLLNDNGNIGGEGDHSSSPSSLLDLLGGGEGDQNGISSKGSLLELLDDDVRMPTSSGRQSGGSRVDLVDGVETIEKTMSRSSDSNDSLLDLLDDDTLFNEADALNEPVEGDAAKEVKNGPSPNSSLLDLLDEDIVNESEPVSGQHTSLLDMLDDVEFEVDENLSDFNDVTIEETIEAYPLKLATMRAQALITSMRKQDWKILDQKNDLGEHDNDDDQGIQILEKEQLISDLFDDSDDTCDIITGENSENADDRGDDFVEELLTGSSTNRWALHSDEFNVLLLNVATSTSSDKLGKMLDIYLHMKELEASGHAYAGPNSETYAILFSVFDHNLGASAIAFELCNQMIEHLTNCVENSGGEEQEKIVMSEETLEIAMRIQAKRLNVDGAESIMNWALSDRGGGIMVNPNIFKMLLVLYKSQNQQEKALELIKTCLEENTTQDWPGLHKFLMSAGSWPQKNRQREKIAISSYCKFYIKILEEQSGPFVPSFYVWRKLLDFSLYAAKVESATNWSLVHRCCKALLSHQKISQIKTDDKFLQVGLDVAEKMRDPQMAADVICSTSMSQGFNAYGDAVDESGSHQKIPPSIYMKAVQLCVDCGMPSLGDRILSHSSQNNPNIPAKFLSDMHTLVLTGYARNGDAEKAGHIFNQMKMAQLRLSESAYAAYIHALAVNKRHDEAMSILDTMLESSNDDGIQPGISSFTACMLGAMQSEAFEDVIRLNDKMKKVGVQPNTTTFQGILLANARLGKKSDVVKEIESVLSSQTPMDARSFLLCAKYLIPSILKDEGGDIELIRIFLRKQVEENPHIKHEAMELNKSLKDCLREDQRKPSKMKNEVLIKRERNKLWRVALNDAIGLSRVLETER